MTCWMRSNQVAPGAPASIMVSTSLSELDEKPTPWRSMPERSSAALTRLPLCATAIGPYCVSIRKGWALLSADEPVVE